MVIKIASQPRRVRDCLIGFVKGVFRECSLLVRKGVGLGVVLFCAFLTLSLLNEGMDGLKRLRFQFFLADQVPTQVGVVAGLMPGSQVLRQVVRANVDARIPVKQNEAANSRDLLRESRYFVNELGQMARMLAGFQK